MKGVCAAKPWRSYYDVVTGSGKQRQVYAAMDG
jgi:hypothetical protein